MFDPKQILFEDNHLMIVNKPCGIAVQEDTTGDPALENLIKEYIKKRDAKAGNVFLGVVHRIDRPVSGAVILAKTSKALARLNEMVKKREIEKRYWAITERKPETEQGRLIHHIERDGKKNRSFAYSRPGKETKEAILDYELICVSKNFYLLEIGLITGRHHQIRAQLSKIGCPIRGDLKYGAARSNTSGGISLHSRSVQFVHPVSKQEIKVTAPVPSQDNLWEFFEQCMNR